LTWGQFNEPLFAAMEPFVRATFGRMVILGDDRRALASRLAGLAAFYGSNPWDDQGWLFQFIAQTETSDRTSWAHDFGQYLEGLPPARADTVWNGWVRSYWDARLTGVPRPLDDEERETMIAWAVPFRTRLSEMIQRFENAPPSKINHFRFYHLRHAGLAAFAGVQTGKLLRVLLGAAQTVEWDTGEVHDLALTALSNGGTRDDLLSVANDMARLGCSGAESVRAATLERYGENV